MTADIIGQHMADFLESNGLSKKPRKLLVSGMKAEKILIASPLLKWYLEFGLQVTRIYMTLEYGKAKCFQ